jgi:hypothetical protein
MGLLLLNYGLKMWTVNWFVIFISIIEGTAPIENSSQSGAGPGPVGVNVAPTSSVRSSSTI